MIQPLSGWWPITLASTDTAISSTAQEPIPACNQIAEHVDARPHLRDAVEMARMAGRRRGADAHHRTGQARFPQGCGGLHGRRALALGRRGQGGGIRQAVALAGMEQHPRSSAPWARMLADAAEQPGIARLHARAVTVRIHFDEGGKPVARGPAPGRHGLGLGEGVEHDGEIRAPAAADGADRSSLCGAIPTA